MPETVPSTNSAAAIRQEVDRILASRVFFTTQRSQTLLRYLVERSLLSSAPKEYEIALEVLGRGPDYDPAVDAAVRVEAGRLRGRLREYYETQGQADPILITVPKGGYAAVFEPRENGAFPSTPESTSPAPGRNGQTNGQTNGANPHGAAAELLPLHRSNRAVWQPLDRASAPAEPVPAEPTPAEAQRPVPRRSIPVMLWVAFALAAFALTWLLANRLIQGKKPVAGPIRSLAVLPLQNLSGTPSEDYFVDGMTDQLTTELAHLPEIRVVSRTSAMQKRGNRQNVRQIAQDLGVDAIVEGSVVRSGGRVRITAQLIDARKDRHLWAETYEEPIGDVLTLQDKVVREIAAQMQVALAPADPAHAAPHLDPEAYDAYLRGLYFLHQREAHKSAAYFRQAIDRDPAYAAAYAGLAEALASEGVVGEPTEPDTEAQALAAAQRAIQLDPHNGAAYASLGLINVRYQRNWPEAGRTTEIALQLDPNDSLAQMQYAIYLDAMNRPEDAVAHMRSGLKLDPLSFLMNRHLGSVLYFARHYDESLSYLNRAREMEPSKFGYVVSWASRDYEMTGRFDNAVATDLQGLGTVVSKPQMETLRAAYRTGGWKSYQLARINLLLHRTDLNECDRFEIGESYVRLGQLDQAFPWLERGTREGCFWADSIPVSPLLDPLRSDPRYPHLLHLAHL